MISKIVFISFLFFSYWSFGQIRPDYITYEVALKNPLQAKKVRFFSQMELNNIKVFENIEEVEAEWNDKIDSLPNDLFSIKSIKTLHLAHNNIKELSAKINKLSNLEHLDLQTNPIERLPKSFEQLKKIKHLNLGIGNLPYFPTQVFSLKSLEFFAFNGFGVDYVPEGIFNLTNLKELYLPTIHFGKISNKLSQLKKIEKLGLGLNYFPKEICTLTNLKILYFSNLFLSPIDIPKEIANLKKLELFTICQVKHIPEEIKLCISLKKLMIQYSDLNFSAVSNIFNISSLEHLDLAECKIAIIPPNISNLINIKRLILNNNKISKLPYSITLLDTLDDLELRRNSFTTFPEELCELKNIKILAIDDNKIAIIPNCVLKLSNIRSFIMGGIKSFPMELLNLNNTIQYDEKSLSEEMREKIRLHIYK